MRNGASYVVTALLGGRLTGAARSWLPPLAYGIVAVVAPLLAHIGRASNWLWPIQPATERPAAIIAAAPLLLGLAVGTLFGARLTADEAARATGEHPPFHRSPPLAWTIISVLYLPPAPVPTGDMS